MESEEPKRSLDLEAIQQSLDAEKQKFLQSVQNLPKSPFDPEALEQAWDAKNKKFLESLENLPKSPFFRGNVEP